MCGDVNVLDDALNTLPEVMCQDTLRYRPLDHEIETSDDNLDSSGF
jgi:hypothetical protein